MICFSGLPEGTACLYKEENQAPFTKIVHERKLKDSPDEMIPECMKNSPKIRKVSVRHGFSHTYC